MKSGIETRKAEQTRFRRRFVIFARKNARDFEAFVKYVNCDETITCRFTMSNRCEYVTSVNSRYESYFRGRVIFSTKITHVTS